MKDKTNRNEKVNIINQKYKEEISKETLAKGMLASALAVGAVGSMEALKPSTASAAMVEGNFGLVNMKGSATVVSIDIGGAIDSAIKHVQSMSAESTQERINIVNSFIKSLDQKLGNKPSERKTNVAIIKATNEYKFLKPYIPGIQQGEEENLHLFENSQTYTIQLAGENYIVHVFTKDVNLHINKTNKYVTKEDVQYMGAEAMSPNFIKFGNRL